MSPKLETSNEEDKRDTNGVGPLGIKVIKEPWNFRGGMESPKKEVAKQTLEQIEFVL